MLWQPAKKIAPRSPGVLAVQTELRGIHGVIKNSQKPMDDPG